MSEASTGRVSDRDKADVFRQMVEDNKKAVYYLALDLSGSHHDAEDLSQEVFIKAHRGLDTFRGDASVESWLRRITVNTFLNTRRKKALRFMQLFEDGQEDLAEQNQYAAPDMMTEAEQINKHVHAAMAKLSPSERSVFVLRHFNDLAVKEIASSMDVADGTVKSLLFRATKKMQQSLAFYRVEAPAIRS